MGKKQIDSIDENFDFSIFKSGYLGYFIENLTLYILDIFGWLNFHEKIHRKKLIKKYGKL